MYFQNKEGAAFGRFLEILTTPHTGTYFGVCYPNFTETTQKTILNSLNTPLLIFRDRPPEVQVSDLAVFQAILQEAKMGIKIKNLFLKSQLKKVRLLPKHCSFSFKRVFTSFWTEKKYHASCGTLSQSNKGFWQKSARFGSF